MPCELLSKAKKQNPLISSGLEKCVVPNGQFSNHFLADLKLVAGVVAWKPRKMGKIRMYGLI